MRRYLTPRERVLMLERQHGKCLMCDAAIDGTGKTCIAEHWHPVELGNDQKPDCLLCIACADVKTNGTKATSYGSDKHAIAKVKRILRKLEGSWRPNRKKIQGQGFTAWRKFNGEIVRRDV